jgi:plasmid stability protein
MGQVLIRAVEDDVLQSLKQRAADHGHSLEAELRLVLTQAARQPRADLVAQLATIRAQTPPGPRTLAEDLVREGREER